MGKKRQNLWKKIKNVLQNRSANFSTEKLCFSDKSISVKKNMSEYSFWGTFVFAGVIALCIIPGQETKSPWVGYFIGILFSVVGSLMLYISASEKLPYIDLEKQLFYPVPKARKTPIKISEISSFCVVQEGRWHELGAVRNQKFYRIYSSKGILPYIHGKMLSEKFNLPWQQSIKSVKRAFITHYLCELSFLLIFIFCIAAGAYNNCIVPLKKIAASKNWIETQATILYSKFNKFTYQTTYRPPNEGGGLKVVIKPSTRTRQSSELIIEYVYEYQNQKHQSDRYDFFINSPNNIGTKQMREIAENHPAQKTVTCFVNPDNPAEAVLSRKIFWRIYLFNCTLLIILAALLTAFTTVSKEILIAFKCFFNT